ncbi:hypothetical protein Ccrd_014039, partial [Cynara cardunculus var. scolymus]
MIEEANTSWHNDKWKPRGNGSDDDDDEDDEDDDAAQDKARAFDDWKDDNPQGAGNKKLIPCALSEIDLIFTHMEDPGANQVLPF